MQTVRNTTKNNNKIIAARTLNLRIRKAIHTQLKEQSAAAQTKE